MRHWSQRPIEEANLFNPAFNCIVLTSFVIGYMNEGKNSVTYPLAFLVLPTVLHNQTRISLPKTVRTSLACWLQEHSEIRIMFAERAASLTYYTKESIMFGLLHGWLMLREGKLASLKDDKEAIKLQKNLELEARECVRAAYFVGRWFAKAGTPETIMALWGVKP